MAEHEDNPMDLDDIDLLELDQYVRGVPHEQLALLRREAPVFRHAEADGPGFWVLSRHEDIQHCSRNPEMFSSAAERGGVVFIDEPSPERKAFQTLEAEIMFLMDPPRHTRLRMLVNRAFTPRRIKQLEEQVLIHSTRSIDAVIEQGRCDLVEAISRPLPLQVICDLMDVPGPDRQMLCDFTDAIAGNDDPEFQLTDGAALEARFGLLSYIMNLREERRARPGDDVFSMLLSATETGEQLTDMEIDLFFMLLFVAGNETTRNAISHGVHALIENPDQLALLKAHPELIDSAVEEILRWASPIFFFRRNVTCDTEVRGVPMKEGDKVAMWYMSANRDEHAFEDPFRFDIARRPNDHITFGGGGPHHCLGASLARLELKVLIEQLALRVSDLELDGDVVRLRSLVINGVKHMPVAFRPGPRVGATAR